MHDIIPLDSIPLPSIPADSHASWVGYLIGAVFLLAIGGFYLRPLIVSWLDAKQASVRTVLAELAAIESRGDKAAAAMEARLMAQIAAVETRADRGLAAVRDEVREVRKSLNGGLHEKLGVMTEKIAWLEESQGKQNEIITSLRCKNEECPHVPPNHPCGG